LQGSYKPTTTSLDAKVFSALTNSKSFYPESSETQKRNSIVQPHVVGKTIVPCSWCDLEEVRGDLQVHELGELSDAVAERALDVDT
jgi:hypothetical protein